MQFSRKQLNFFSIMLYLFCMVVIGLEAVLNLTLPVDWLALSAIFAVGLIVMFVMGLIPRRRSPRYVDETFHTYEGGWIIWLVVSRLGWPMAMTIYALVVIHDPNSHDLIVPLLLISLGFGQVCSEFYRTRSKSPSTPLVE